MFGNIQRDMAYANMATRQTSATGKSATAFHVGGFRQVSSLVEYQQNKNIFTQIPLQTVPSFPIGAIPANLTDYTPEVSVSGNGKLIAYAYLDKTTLLPVLKIYNSEQNDYSVQFTSTPADATALLPGIVLNNAVITCTISKDGSTCVLGYLGDDGGKGAIWTYYNSGTSWSQTSLTKIIPAGIVGTIPHFGFCLALSIDKSTLVVGAPKEGFIGNELYVPGAIFVYKLVVPGLYSLFGSKIVGTNLTDIAYQGFSVSVSANGSSILFGAPYDGYFPPTQPLPQGSVFIFIQNSPSSPYIQEDKIKNNSQNFLFGITCALTCDSTTAYVGTSGYITKNEESGVFVYERQGKTWIKQNIIRVPNSSVGSNIGFGTALAVSEDGNTVAVSCIQDIINPSVLGSTFIFSKSGNFTYTQNGPKLYNPLFNTIFTNTIGLSADGKVLATAGYTSAAPIGIIKKFIGYEKKFKAQFEAESVALLVYISL